MASTVELADQPVDPARPNGPTWGGLARMAEARRAAGLPLSELDVEALRIVPEPEGFAGLPRAVSGDRTPDTGHGFDPVEVEARIQAARERRRREHAESLAAGRARRDDAIERVDEHADPDWKTAARAALRRIAEEQATLTGDDLWRLVPKPAEPRASGAVFRWAATERLIAPTDRFVPTTQATSHASPSRVWRSLIYREEHDAQAARLFGR